MQIPSAVPARPGNQCLAVDHPLESRIRHWLDHWRAVDRHQNGRRIADQHPRRVVSDLRYLWLDRLRSNELALQEIQRHRRHHCRQFAAQLPQIVESIIGNGWEAHPGQAQVLQRNGAGQAIDADARLAPDHAERLLARSRVPDRHGRTEIERVTLPAFHLWKIDQRRGHGHHHLAWPPITDRLRRGGRLNRVVLRRQQRLFRGIARRGRLVEAGIDVERLQSGVHRRVVLE
jgi:hypothetical protein